MAITVEIYEEIRRCREKYGYGQRQTARLLKVSRNTVKKYWDGSTVPWERKQGSGRKNDVLTDEHLKFISECLEEDKQAPKKQRQTAHRIFTRLCEEKGYTGCESAVRAAVAERRKRITNCFVPLAYDPGESMQIDWGETTVFLKGVKTKINIWCMRECYSADIFVMAFMRQNEESFLEGILNGFEYFGGVPRKLIFDNAKVAVKDGFGANATATDKYKAMAAHYAFTPVFCNVAQGHEKGLVEGLVGFSRRNFFAPLPRYESLDELNAYLREKCIDYRKTKIPGKPMSVGEMAKVALQSYIPLPSYRFDTSKTVEHKADSFALVKFDGNKYSVPYQYSNKTVTVKGYGDRVVFMFHGEIIAQYDRDYRHDETNFRLEHYIDLIERKPRSVYDAAPVKRTLPKPFYEFILTLDKPKEIIRILRCYLGDPNAAMKAIQAANYEEFLLKYELAVGRETSVNSLCKRVETNNIPVNPPHLEQYDNLLRREGDLMEQNAANELIKLYAKQLRLPSFNKFAKVVQQLEPSEGYADFLLKLMKTELDDRQHTAQEKRIKNARFPTIKTLDEFDTHRLEHISEGCIRELSSCDFISKRQNVLMVGNPGSGKTHLATALGISACCAGFKVRFYTAGSLATELSEALQENRLSKLERSLSKFDLLIIDELSYLTFNRSQSELLFQVISERSERASVIITTNLEFSQWTQLFENEMMVAALVDRVTFNSQILNMNCTTSYRMETALNGQPARRT